MAWHFKAGTIAKGASHRWFFWWGGKSHSYRGVQVVQARPIPYYGGLTVITPAELRISDEALKIEVNGGYTYFVTVTNVGPWEVDYEIVGQRVD